MPRTDSLAPSYGFDVADLRPFDTVPLDRPIQVVDKTQSLSQRWALQDGVDVAFEQPSSFDVFQKINNLSSLKNILNFVADPKKKTDPAETEVEKAKARADYNSTEALGGQRDVQVDGYHHDDVKQGGLADCYFMAAVAALCDADASAIDNMISNEKRDASGNLVSCDVRLYVKNEAGKLEPITVTVDCTSFGKKRAQVGDVSGTGVQELWPMILEKAFAQVNPEFYYGIGANGGNTGAAMEALTGKTAGYTDMKSYSFDQLEKDLAAGKLISFGTDRVYNKDGSVIKGKEALAKALSDANVSHWHAYSIVESKVENGVQMVKVYNPWGTNQPGSGEADGGWMTYEDAKKLFAGATVGSR
jgi:hypothetical protein